MTRNKNRKSNNRYLFPGILTIIFILSGIAVPLIWGDQVDLSNIASWISALVSGVAFIWLVYGYFLQKEVIDLQRIQIERMGRFEAAKQIKDGFDHIEEKIRKLRIDNLNDIEDLGTNFFLIFAESAKNIVEDPTSEQLKWDSIKKWSKVKSLCDEFLNNFVMFVKMYDESTQIPCSETNEEKKPKNLLNKVKELNIDDKIIEALSSVLDNNDAWFIKSNIKNIKEIPVLSRYSKTALAVADAIIRFEPGIDLIELEMFKEAKKISPGCVKKEPFEKLRKKVEDRERERKKNKKS